MNEIAPKSSEQLASDIIKTKIDSTGVSSQTNISLSTKTGHSMSITVKNKLPTQEKSTPMFPLKSISNIQSQLSLSDKQTLQLEKNIRSTTHNRTAIEVHLKKKLIKRNHILDDFFELKSINYETLKLNRNAQIEKETIYCKNSWITFLMKEDICPLQK